jgi:hypothetical protein
MNHFAAFMHLVRAAYKQRDGRSYYGSLAAYESVFWEMRRGYRPRCSDAVARRCSCYMQGGN